MSLIKITSIRSLLVQRSHIITSVCYSTTKVQSDNKAADLQDAWNKARPYSEVPGPTAWEMMKMFRKGGQMDGKSFYEIVDEFQRLYGNICKLPGSLGKSDIIFAYEPEDFETIFRTEGAFPERSGLETLDYYRSKIRKDIYGKYKGLSVSQGQEWWEFRQKVNPVLMKPTAIKPYVPQMDAISKEFVEKIQQKKDVDNKYSKEFLLTLNRWALESVSCISLDIRLGLLGDQVDPKAEKFMNSLKLFFEYTYALDILPSIWKFYKTPLFHKSMKNMDEMVDGALYFLEKGKQALEERKRMNLDADGEKGILEKLLEIDEQIALIMTMDSVIAGVDTISATFFFLLHNLAHNPEKQELLRREIMQVLISWDSTLTAEAIHHMPYLRACVKESHRFSPLLDNFRSAGRDLVLQGFQIPKSTRISLAQHSLLRSDSQYERSDEFLPERFLRQEKGTMTESGCPRKVEAHPFIYLPFGFGPRMCIGRRFAELEIETLIVRMLRQFRVEWNGPPPTIMSSFSQLPVGDTSFVFNEIKK